MPIMDSRILFFGWVIRVRGVKYQDATPKFSKILNATLETKSPTSLQQSERILEKKYKPKRTIDDLIAVVADKVGISPELICSRSRQKKPSEARAIFSYLAVEETGYPAADVARFLGVKRMSVHEAVTRGKTLCAEYALLGQEGE
jgi:chromosomal replication initiation ATPase DnaA